jgi:ferredoxin
VLWIGDRMILKREFYDLMPWGAWLRLRLRLHWARATGGMARTLGIRGTGPEIWESTLAQGVQRAVPTFGPTIQKQQMLAAAAVCPTSAFKTDEQNRRTLLQRQLCVLCGLCYFVAPDALRPGQEDEQTCLPGREETLEFPWS